MLDLYLLGCGGGMPMPYRNLSATLFNYQGRKILIDCGEGTQVSMRSIGAGFKAIDVICITHCHGDHIIGLTGLLSTIGNSGREEPLTLIGPIGITDVVKGLTVITRFLPYEVIIVENPKEVNFKLGKERIELSEKKAQITLNTLQLQHSIECLGYSFNFYRNNKFSLKKAQANNVPRELWSRLQKGNENGINYNGIQYRKEMVLGEERKGIKISLITDSRPLDSMINFIKESDLFICEGTYGDDSDLYKALKNQHMTFREAATLAREGNCEKLLLTHFSPSMIEPQEFISNSTDVFKNTIIGYDRMMMTLSFSE